MAVDGIISEQNINFVGKDGFYWWIGEVEDNEDPLNVGRVKVRVLNYYTNPAGGSSVNLPTDDLPWATVLQHTAQAGNDRQGESSGQLQPGAIVMGMFMDGESAQMPLVMGVLRLNKGEITSEKKYILTGETIPEGLGVNAATIPPGSASTINKEHIEPIANNSVALPNSGIGAGSSGAPSNIGNAPGISGSSSNPQKPTTPSKPIPTASGTGGPWKMLEYKLTYLLEDLASTAGNLVKSDSGEFIDVVENKIVTLEKLLGKIKNFLSAVFAQIVSAMRQQLDELCQKIEDAGFIASFLGIPSATFLLVQNAITAILSSICGIDSQIISFINDPIGQLTSIVDGIVSGVIDKASAVVQGAQQIIDSIICNVQRIINDVKGIIDVVKGVVQGVQGVEQAIDAWEKGSEIFTTGQDILQNGLNGLIGILSLLLELFDFGCDRKANGGEDNIGWFPFFGTTSCTPQALALLPLGNSRGSCGGGSGGGFLDSFFEEADPYLTTAKNFVNGAYSMQLGTPGRQATITKDASGKTTTSIKQNNAALAEYKARKAIREQNPDLTKDQLEAEVAKYKKSQSGTEGDQSNLIADHTSYPGNHTQEVHGDDCKTIDGDYCRTIDGDYRLKVTGDCHIEVGGGFFFNAQGAPKQVDNEGKEAKAKDKIQKHTITFGSDVDLSVVGAGLKANCMNMEIGARDLKLAGSSFVNKYSTITNTGGEFVVNAGNAITMNTGSLLQNIGVDNPLPTTGYYCNIGGPCLFTIASAATAPFTFTGPGAFIVNSATVGASFNIAAGAFNVNAAAGAISMNASAAASITCSGAMTLTAGPSMKLSAGSIFLN